MNLTLIDSMVTVVLSGDGELKQCHTFSFSHCFASQLAAAATGDGYHTSTMTQPHFESQSVEEEEEGS